MFTFNPYSGLLLVGVVQGLVYAVLLGLRARREERFSDVFASLILVIGTLYAAQWMLGFAGWYDSRDWRTTVMFYVDWSHLAAMGPLVWIYFRALTNTDFRWRRRDGWHFAPALLFLLSHLLFAGYDTIIHAGIYGNAFECFGGSRGPAMDFKNERLSLLNDVEDVFVRPQLPVYLYLTLREYLRYRRYITGEFSNAGELGLRGLRNLLYVLLAGLLAALLGDLLSLATGTSGYEGEWPRYFFMSVMVFAAAILFYGLDLRRTGQLRFASPASPSEEGTAESWAAGLGHARVPEAGEDIDRWAEALDARLAAYSDYLEPELKLADLAARIGTNASVLSRVINSRHGVNFNDFVNNLRCASFLERIRRGEHQRHTLLSLALDSGFNSKSTFNRAFRKAYGFPPGEAALRLGADHDLGGPKG